MEIFERVKGYGHEQVVFFQDKTSGLKAIVAIHDTTLGPALGGCRMWSYASDEEALIDVLRLSQGMTYKAAAAGLKLGGGKAVIIGDPKKDKSEILFRAFGKCVNTLNGRYITAEDVGTDVNDMEFIYMETPYVTGVDQALGGSGDPAPFTAYGVLQGMKASIEAKLRTSSFAGVKVAVQGLGHVGWHLTKLLRDEGATIIATDIDPEICAKAKKELGVAEIVDPNEIYDVTADVFAPCALGAIINDQTVERLKVKVVSGAANNQLKEDRHGEILARRKILYMPDYVINAGGLINVYVELEGYSRDRAIRLCRNIYYNCKTVYEISEKEGMPTYRAADRMVEKRIESISRIKPHFNTFPRGDFDKRR